MTLSEIYERNGRRLSSEELSAASYEELVDLRSLVDSEISSISIQINHEKARDHSGQGAIDPAWYHRAMGAKQAKGHLVQRIQREISRRKKDQKEANVRRDEERQVHSLIQAMRMELTEDQLKAVLDRWKEIR